MAAKVVSITTLVDMLCAAEGDPITSERIRDLLTSVRVDRDSLRPFAHWSGDLYARHLIHRDRWFDILTICWQPGQGTPIHTHNGQLGWAFPVQGAIECVEYAYRGCDRPENQNVAGLDCLAGGMQVKLDPTVSLTVTPGGPVNVVDKRVTIHSLAAPADDPEPALSVHVYSLPFDSCVEFDVARGRCRRRELYFDSAPEGYEVRVRS